MEKERKNQPKTTAETLSKMKAIHEGHKKRRKELGKQIKRANARFEGATREVLKRRFLFDIAQLQERRSDAMGKEEWAGRMIKSMEATLAMDEKGNLANRPFTSLKTFKLK